MTDPRQAVTERRVVTILFADMVGSTEATAARDVEQMRAGLAVAFDHARRILEAHGGTVEKFIGDAVMAVFGVPRAHDDDAERAVRAAVALNKLADELPASVGFPMRFRIGINTGEVATGVAAGRDFLVTGLPVNVAARLYPAAEPGGILVGSLTRSLTEGAIRYADAIAVEGKGTSRVDAWRVDGVLAAEPGATPRGIPGLQAPMVGRDTELALLNDLMGRVARERQPHLVTVLGDAGVGKSRLVREFARRTEAAVRVGRCLPYGEAVEYHAIRSVIAEEAQVGADDAPRAARTKLLGFAEAHWTDGTGRTIADRLSVLAGFADVSAVMPGVSAEDVALELRWAFRKLIARTAAERPLLLVFEDVHWAAGTLLDLIEDLVERCEGPLLVACLARPELTDLRPGWGTQGTHASTIRVQPLEPAASQQLVLALLRTARLPKQLISDIVERSGGNPLYLEEIVRGLIASGHLRRSDTGWEAGAAEAPAGVPDTLRGVITARLDRLPRSTRSLLQRGSVLGRYFPLQGARALAADQAVGPDATQQAVRSGFLVASNEGPMAGGYTYHFRHALIRDAVYESIPKQERQQIHLRAADWFASRQAEAGEDLAELRAHHLEQAHLFARDLSDPDRDDIGRRAYDAIIALTRRARSRFASYEATVSFYDRAEQLAADLEIPLVERKDEFAWAAVVRHVPKHGDLDQSEMFRALEQVRELGPTAGLAQLLAYAAQHAGPEGLALAAESVAVARATGDPAAIAWSLWLTRMLLDPKDHRRSWSLLEEVLDIARRHEERGLLSFALVAMAERAHNEGQFTRARTLQEEAYANAVASGVKGSIANAAMFLGLGYGAIREPEPMVKHLDQAIAAAREAINPAFLPSILWLASWGEYQNGLLDSARGHAEAANELTDPAVWPDTAVAVHHMLARICAAQGDIESASAHQRALDPLVRDATHRVHRSISAAHIEAVAGRPAEAERSFREALDEMDRPELLFGYVPWSWSRALTQESLAELLASQGREEEAKAMLRAALGFWSDPLGARRRAEIEAKIAALGA